MKIVALHTDFRIYWPARLKALNSYLIERESSLDVIEISGKGSPYAFDNTRRANDISWHILFPDSKPEELSGKIIKPILFELLDKLNPDVILAGAIAFPSGALAVQWANSRPNKRVIIFDDAKNDAVKRNFIVNFIKRNVYNGVDAMLYPAEPWIETGQFWGFDRTRLYFGVDVVDNDFWAEPVEKKTFDFKYFVAVGRQIPKKNFLTIVKAFHKYYKTVSDDSPFNLVLIGNGPEHKKICDYIEKHNLGNIIHCYDYMSQTELKGVYQNADLLCVGSDITETWGLVINEAMCGGCAIIASRQCGATDVLVQDGINGYKIECHDIDGLAEAMLKYHRLSADNKIKMQQASMHIISDWGLDRFCQGVYDACSYITEHHKRKGSIIAKIIQLNWYGQYRPV